MFRLDQFSVWNLCTFWILSIWRQELMGAEGQLEAWPLGTIEWYRSKRMERKS